MFLNKNLTGGLGLFFWVWNFWYSYFFGFRKISLIFWVWRFFTYFFGVAILIEFIFLGVRSDESHKLHKGLIFWVCNFHEVIFLGLIFPGIYFFGYPKKCMGRAPLSFTCQSTLPGVLKILKMKNFKRSKAKTSKAKTWETKTPEYLLDESFVFVFFPNSPCQLPVRNV